MLEAVRRAVLGEMGETEARAAIDELAGAALAAARELAPRLLFASYAAGGGEPEGGGLGRDYLALMTEDLTQDLARLTAYLSDDAKAALREAARLRVESAVLRGEALRSSEELARDLEERGVRFTDRSGRRWSAEGYAEMVVRTKSAEVLNAGTLHAAARAGSRYVRVSDGGPSDTDEPCRRADGQVWSLAYAARNKLEHPNCRRSFAALPESYAGPADRE